MAPSAKTNNNAPATQVAILLLDPRFMQDGKPNSPLTLLGSESLRLRILLTWVNVAMRK